MENAAVARIFSDIADWLALKGENAFHRAGTRLRVEGTW